MYIGHIFLPLHHFGEGAAKRAAKLSLLQVTQFHSFQDDLSTVATTVDRLAVIIIASKNIIIRRFDLYKKHINSKRIQFATSFMIKVTSVKVYSTNDNCTSLYSLEASVNFQLVNTNLSCLLLNLGNVVNNISNIASCQNWHKVTQHNITQ